MRGGPPHEGPRGPRWRRSELIGAAVDLLELAAVRTVAAAARSLPLESACGLGIRLADFGRRRGWKTDVVTRQIGASFPDASAEWVDGVARACYAHFGREGVIMARLRSMSRDELLAMVRTSDITEQRIEEVRSGGGAVFVTGHFGNWELLGSYMASRGVPVSAVVKRQSNRRFDRWLLRSRRLVGIEPIYMEDAARGLPRLIAEGRTAALVADQHAGRRGVDVTFMGRPASTFRGPSRLTRLTGAPLWFGVAYRQAEAYTVSVERVWPRDGDGTAPPSEQALTLAWVQLLEAHVREHPEQYFWFHRRWRAGNAEGDRRYPRAHSGYGDNT